MKTSACLEPLRSVGHTDFMDDAGVVDCLHAAKHDDFAAVEAWGGFVGAERRFVFDTQRVDAAEVCCVVRFEPSVDIGAARTLLADHGLPEGNVGDIQRVGGALEAYALLDDGAPSALTQDTNVIMVDACAQPNWKIVKRIAASMRADALGAAAFNASRSWFSKGIAGGNVFVDGRQAGKSSRVEVGSEIFARGLGRAQLLEIGGQTKRGRTHVTFRLEWGG